VAKKKRRRFAELHLVDSFSRTYDLPKSAEKSIRVRIVVANFKGNDVIRGDIRSFNGHEPYSEMGPGLMVGAGEAERLGLTKLAKAIRMYERQAKNVIQMQVALREPKPAKVKAADRVAAFVKGLPAAMRRDGVPVALILKGVRMKKQSTWAGLNELLRRKQMTRDRDGARGRAKRWWLTEDKETGK
jgi:hypothetical protein